MPATLHIRNARIWTGDHARPWARDMVIEGGRIAAIDGVAAGAAAAPVERVIDARGCVVTPGLIDSHVHLLKGGQSLGEVDLSAVRSRDEFERVVGEAHARLPDDRWLIARGWSQENWPNRTMPDKQWLRAAGARPCVCHRMDMHAAVVNEPVLKMCGAMDRDDPQGGRIDRDAGSSAPTGIMIEEALWQLVNPLVPEPTAAAKRECLIAAQAQAHRLGLTAVGSMEYARDVEKVYAPLRDQLTLRCRMTLLDREWGAEPMSFDFGREFVGDDRLAVIGYKAFIDGTMGSRTARLLAEYADDPGNRGLLVELAAAGHLGEWASGVAEAGLSPSMHAIGDEAARLALDAIAALSADIRRKARPRVEHAQQIDLADMPRFKGLIASMQPLHKADDARYLTQRLGEHRTRGSFAFRSLRNVGATLAFGSDWPVVSLDPVLGMRAAITGLTLDGQPFGMEQNLIVEEALRAYTRDAAYCLHMNDAGVLREGMLADCVMFDIDPFTADWAHRPPHVIMTVVGGKVVFDET